MYVNIQVVESKLFTHNSLVFYYLQVSFTFPCFRWQLLGSDDLDKKMAIKLGNEKSAAVAVPEDLRAIKR